MRVAVSAAGRRVAIVVMVLIIAVSVIAYSVVLAGQGQTKTTASTTSSSTRTSSSGPDGVIAGYVTVGPSKPVCSANESSCNFDLTGYSLQMSSVCTGGLASCKVQNFSASIAPSGHYSILLAPGNYTMTGLSPSCPWLGCSSTFPKAITVEAGQQEIVDVTVDTGIR